MNLTKAFNPDLPGLSEERYTYDNVGNRLNSSDTTGSWYYNANNELAGYDNTHYEYDANGNMTRKTVGGEVTSYVYNTEDRLSEIWSGESGTGILIARYYYDPFGRRLMKEVSGVRTFFMYSDEGLTAEMDAAGTVTKTYGWHPGGTWGTDPLFMTEGANASGTPRYYFYHNDHLGTPQKLTSTSGAVVWSATYTAFGDARVDPGSIVTNNLRFPGQYWDGETGVHYNWFRYYEPKVGRYLRIDPSHKKQPISGKSVLHLLPYIIFSPSQLNASVYALNNSLKRYDPTGLISEECCYEMDLSTWCCIRKGPKKLDLTCFTGCLARNVDVVLIGVFGAGGMTALGQPVLGGILFATVSIHIYVECYVPCKACPSISVRKL